MIHKWLPIIKYDNGRRQESRLFQIQINATNAEIKLLNLNIVSNAIEIQYIVQDCILVTFFILTFIKSVCSSLGVHFTWCIFGLCQQIWCGRRVLTENNIQCSPFQVKLSVKHSVWNTTKQVISSQFRIIGAFRTRPKVLVCNVYVCATETKSKVMRCALCLAT